MSKPSLFILEKFEDVSAEKQTEKIKNPENVPASNKAEEGTKNVTVSNSLNNSKNRSENQTKNKTDKSIDSKIIFLRISHFLLP